MSERDRRRVRLSFALHDDRVAPGASALDAAEVVELWERAAEPLRNGLRDLGSDLELQRAEREYASFAALVPGTVLSEALRLGMSWVGRTPHRDAELTGPVGSLLLTSETAEGGEELDRVGAWLRANGAN